jgi:hypothetical protein
VIRNSISWERAKAWICYSPPGGFSDGLVVSRFPRSRCCVAFSPGLVASDGARSVSDLAPASLRPVGGVVSSCVPLVPRFSSVGEVPVAPPRVPGETDSCGLPPRAGWGLVAAVACGLGDLAGEADDAGKGDLAPGGDEVAAGDMAPAGDALVPADVVAPVVVAPVVVLAPVVEVEPETPTPTAAPALTP